MIMAEKVRKKKRRKWKSLGRRMSRLMTLVVLLIIVLSTVLNWTFMSGLIDGIFYASGDNIAASIRLLIRDEKGNSFEGYVEDVLDVYRSIPEDVRSDPDAEEYQAYFSRFEQDSRYQELMGYFSRIGTLFENVYLVAFDPDTMALIRAIDLEERKPGEDNPFWSHIPVGYWEKITPEDYDLLTDETEREEAFGTLVANWVSYHKDKDDRVYSVGRSIMNSDGEIIGFSMVDVSGILVKVFATTFTIFYLVLFGILAFVIYLVARNRIRKRIVKPIRAISSAAEEYGRSGAENKEGSSYFGSLSVHTGDELEELCEVMAGMEKDIAVYEKNLVAAAKEKERLRTELSVATAIQQSMLPDKFPESDKFELYASMDPAKEVGGDFYDFFMIDDSHLGLVIADVSGKGIPAALFMMASMITIRDLAFSGLRPGELLEKANNRIYQSNSSNMFVTVWFGILDLDTGVVTTANGGHEYPAVCHMDGNYELVHDPHSIALGIMDGIKYKEFSITLEQGSTLFVYTDGVPEATDAHEELYGTDRMIAALNKARNASAKETLTILREDIDRFVGDAEQFDDLTMLCVKYGKPI